MNDFPKTCVKALPAGGGMLRSCGATPTTVVSSMTGYPLDLCLEHAAEERRIQARIIASEEQ